MVSAVRNHRVTTIGDGLNYRVAEHRVTVKQRAGVDGRAETLFEAYTPPAGAMSSYQQPCADESFFVLDGTYSFEIGGVCSELSPGSYVFVPHGVARSFRNTSCTVARMLVMVGPGVRPDSFFARPGAPETLDVFLQEVA